MKGKEECIIHVPFAAHYPAQEGRFRGKNPKHLYSLKKGAGALNKEEIELLFHSLNAEMFVKYKGKTFWSTWETLEQGSGSFIVKGASIQVWLQRGTLFLAKL